MFLKYDENIKNQLVTYYIDGEQYFLARCGKYGCRSGTDEDGNPRNIVVEYRTISSVFESSPRYIMNNEVMMQPICISRNEAEEGVILFKNDEKMDQIVKTNSVFTAINACQQNYVSNILTYNKSLQSTEYDEMEDIEPYTEKMEEIDGEPVKSIRCSLCGEEKNASASLCTNKKCIRSFPKKQRTYYAEQQLQKISACKGNVRTWRTNFENLPPWVKTLPKENTYVKKINGCYRVTKGSHYFGTFANENVAKVVSHMLNSLNYGKEEVVEMLS